MTVFKLSQKKIWITKDKTLRWLKTSERGYDGECVICAPQVKIGKKWKCVCDGEWFVGARCVCVINCYQSNNKDSLETDCLLLKQWKYAVHHYPSILPSPLPSLHHSHAITVLIRPSPAGTSFSFLPSSSPLHWSPSWLFSSLLFFLFSVLFFFHFQGAEWSG